jgi:hypothetical protein
MPKRLLPNIGVRGSVTRPVVLDIARQLLEITGLPADTTIQYPDSDEPNYQPGSTLDPAQDTNTFGAGTNLYLTVEEKTIPEAILSTAVHYPDANWVYADPEVYAFMRPVYSATDFLINIQFRSTDRDAAQAWSNDIKNRLSTLRDVFVHAVSYSYLIPDDHIQVIKEIHRLRENVAPYGQTWEQYTAEKFSNKLRPVSNLSGEQQAWAVAETQDRVQGYFEFSDGPEEGSKQNDNASWTISLSYKFRFDKPTSTYLEYPLVIHNQLLGKKFRQTAPAPREFDRQQRPSLSIEAMQAFETNYHVDWRGRTGVSIPDFDEFIPSQNSIIPSTTRLITGLALVDPDNPTALLDLTQLGTKYSLTDGVKAFMRREYQYLAKPGLSILNVSVYRGQYLMDQGDYWVDENLVVTLKDTPNLRHTFHVRIALFERPRLLPTAAKERMRNDCSTTREFLKALDPRLESKGLLPTCMIGNYMPLAPFNAALEELDKRFDPKYTGEVLQWNTVMSLVVVAKRRDS